MFIGGLHRSIILCLGLEAAVVNLMRMQKLKLKIILLFLQNNDFLALNDSQNQVPEVFIYGLCLINFMIFQPGKVRYAQIQEYTL